MKNKKFYGKILSSTLVVTLLASNINVVLGNAPVYERKTNLVELAENMNAKSTREGIVSTDTLERVGEDIITLSFDTYEGGSRVNMPLVADNREDRSFKVYGFEENRTYVEAVPVGGNSQTNKSLKLVTTTEPYTTTESSIITTGSSIITTGSSIKVNPSDVKLDCAMEGINLQENIAIDFDVIFEDSYSEKALFRGKYKDKLGKLSWYAPSQVGIKGDNKLYIGKVAVADLIPDTWYNFKVAFDFTSNKKVATYWLDGKKIYEVDLKDEFIGIDTIKLLQLPNKEDVISKSYIDNYKVYPCVVKKNEEIKEEKNFLLFENKIQDFISCDENSSIELSRTYTKFGETSLRWLIGENGQLSFDTPIGYEEFAGSTTDQRRESFVVWLYNETPSEETLSFEFQEEGKRKTGFEMGLDFKGWRCAWVMFDRDMIGEPSVGMDNLTIKAPASMVGQELYFSNMILSTPIDARHHTRTPDIPFVNVEADTKANSHWMSLYAFSEKYKEFVPQGNVMPEEREDAELISKRFKQYLYETRKPVAFESLVKSYEAYDIKVQDGKISGRTVDYKNAFATLDAFDKTYYLEKFNSINSKDYVKVLYDMAIYYNTTEDMSQKEQAKEMFINMFWHLYEQGFSAGSSVGTVHHLGYEIRDYFPALYLMKNELKEAGWLEEAKEAMNWFSGLGKIFYEDLKADGVNADVLNTLLDSMLASVLMIEDLDFQVEILREYTQWLAFACSPKPGLKGPFKYDGLGFHHAGFYPAYTRDGLKGLTPMVYILRDTKFRLPQEQHELVKKAVMNFRLFSNREQFLISVSGRHPKGTEKFPTILFKYMALAGNPEGTKEVDEEVAAAYLRLVDKVSDPQVIQFAQMGIEKEAAPSGNWAMNYAALGLHRRDEWLVGVRGHSRYLWANETYQNANLYGRYITHGHIQIMSQGTPVNNEESGYKHEGWDWNSWPGTTTVHLPVDELKSDVRNVDTFSGFEEMLISDETYAGGLDFEGENGMFAMKLHEHPKYEGSHRARKSVFMFDDRVIALGSDIENTDSVNPTRTTLFQSYLTDINEPIFVNSTEGVGGLGYNETLNVGEVSYLVDNNQNGYLIPEGQKLTITRENQESRDQQKGTKTEGKFTKALIEHGNAPKNEGYEYMIVIDTTAKEMEEMKAKTLENKNAIYTVLQKDRNAHIVKDEATGTIGYALFEASDKINKGNIVGIDTPAMVMSKEEEDKLTLSICDPDLRLYEGIDESQYDENGNRIEVSIYSRDWMKNESKMHTLQLEVAGTWKLEEEGQGYKVVGYDNGNTVLAIDCKDAAKVEINLEKTELLPEDKPENKPEDGPEDEPNTQPEDEKVTKEETKPVVTLPQIYSFVDIENHWAKKEIEKVVEKGVMIGKEKGKFEPDELITRAEGAVILDRLLNLPTVTLNKELKDVRKEVWYGESVYKLLEKGIIKGYEDNTYRPHTNMSKMEVLTLLARALKDEKGYKSVDNVDKILESCKEKVPMWAKNDIAWCLVNEWITSEEVSNLSLSKELTRAEMAILLNKVILK